jgi:C-terminal processing protease CtpA/Prc
MAGIYMLGSLGIVACDGGGDSVFDFDFDGDSNWEQGVFLPAETFYARCASPRSGTDPFTNLPYSDIQGTTTDENNFLRSYSDDTYLWYDEIVDRDPGNYNNPLEYFDLLKTTAITASGQDKDKFHFTIPSDEWFQLSQSGVSVGYGATFAILSPVTPVEVVVAYTEADSPATDASVNLARGASILAIDGVDINDETQEGVDILNAGLFPESAGETHTFEILDEGSSDSRMVTMTSQEITSEPVQNVSVISTLSGEVGYMLFNDHISTAEEALIDAVNQLNEGSGITDLVLDLRYNGGGFLDIASELAYMIAGPVPTDGQPFETLQFNDKHPTTDPVTGEPLEPTPFHTTSQGFSVDEGQDLPTLNLSRVFVLTGSDTCSASESIINSLRGVDVEVIQIGSTTCGKPYGFYPTDSCGTTYFTIQFRGVNAANFGDYTDGFSPENTDDSPGELVPGCSVMDDFSNPLGDSSEARLAAALDYRDAPGTCPAASGRPQTATSRSEEGTVIKSPWLKNRILR